VDERARDPIRLETSSVSFFEVSWQADSRTVMGVGRDGATSVWDASSGRLMSRDAGVGAAREGRVLPDGTVAVVLERGQLAIRRNGAWTVGGSIPEDCGGLTPSVTGTMFALGCDHAVMVMGVDGSVLYRRPTPAQVSGLAFAHDDSRLAFVELSGTVWSVQAGSWSANRYLGHTTDIHAAPAFVGDRVVSGDAGGEIRVWSPPAVRAWSRTAASSLRRVASSSDGALLATDSSNGIVRIWDARGNLKKEVKAHDGVIPTVQFSPDDRFVVTPGWDGTVRLTPVDDAATGSMVDADTSQLTGAVPLRDGYLITTGSGKALLWDPRSGSSEVVFSGEYVLRRSDVYDDTAAFGSERGDVYQYDASTAQLRLVARHPAAVDALVYSRDGRWLVTADSAGSIRFSARTPGAASDVVMSLGGGAVSAAIAAGKGVVAVASRDGRLKVFSLEAGTPRLVTSHYAAAKRLAFSPDGSMLAAVCDDGFVRLWDQRTREAAAFPLFTEVPQGITFAARGDSLAVTTAYELLTVRVADLTWIPVSRVERNRVIGRLNVVFQQPRRASDDEHVLFGPVRAQDPR
jgi:WD40 repeat protein